MKKATAILLAAVFLGLVLFFFPKASLADADGCFDSHERCSARSLQADAGIIKTTLMLTICDIALGTCLIAYAL